jgi:ElaB/YqjD/DUF883 family membrane-anchored ribosome-binding protein
LFNKQLGVPGVCVIARLTKHPSIKLKTYKLLEDPFMSRNPFDSKTNDSDRGDFGERRTDNVEKLRDRLEDVAAKAKYRAEQWTESASETADRQRENVSSGLERAASTLHEKATHIPGGPRAVSAVHRLADGMETTASYLRQHNFGDMRDDVISACKKHPVQALVSAVALGFLLGRSVRR